MKDIVVILHADAIPGAREICAGLPDYEVFLFDAALGDPVAATGLRNVRMFTQIGGPSYHSMDHAAHAMALAFERELDAARNEPSGISVVGWQHLNLYYLFITLKWYDALWELMGAHLRQHRIHALINDNPAEYYFNSFVPSLSLVAYLQKHGVPVIAYDYGAKAAPAYRIPDLSGEAPEGVADFLLTHLPTCFYDSEYFCAEMRAAGKSAINVESRYWNVPMEAQLQVGLTDLQHVLVRQTPETQQQVATFTETLRERLRPLLMPHIGLANYCSRQVDHLARLYASQLLLYRELQRYFHAVHPAKLVLSEHDTGFHGPLIAFAEQRSLPVILLPHSKVSGDVEFAYDNILILTHPMQGQPIHDARRKPVANLAISYPERFAGTSATGSGLRTVSLLLNGLSLNGVPYAPTDVYLDGIKRIAAWCRAHEVKLEIRCRPGYPIFTLLHVCVGIETDMLARNLNETIDEHARACDICLMYDMPSTAAMTFLRNSIPILNPVVTLPTTAFLAIVHPDVIVTESLDACLQRLDGFISDPLSLDDFRAAQFRAYLSRFQRARPLRTYLARSSQPVAPNLQRWVAAAPVD